MWKHLLAIYLTLAVVGGHPRQLTGTKLTQIINNLNAHLHIQTNLIIVASKSTIEAESVLRNIEKPKIFVTSEIIKNKEKTPGICKGKKCLYHLISKKILTIAFVPEKRNDDDDLLDNFQLIANATKFYLSMIHYTDILWITQGATSKNLWNFSSICWHNGYTRVLFYTNESVYFYDRFPNMTISPLTSFSQYIIRKDAQNFYGYPFRFPITNSPPRVYRFTDRQGKMQYAGYMYKILITFVEHFNFTFQEYPHDYYDDEKLEMLNALAAQAIEAVPFLTYASDSYDSSCIIINSKALLLVPNAMPIPKYQYLRRPFQTGVWLLHGAVILFSSGLIFWLLHAKVRVWDFSKSFLYIFSLVIYQNLLPITIRSLRFNLLYIMLILYAFIMINTYSCVLASLLVSTIYGKQVETIADLEALNLRMIVPKSDYEYLRNLPDLPPIILNISFVVDGVLVDWMRRNLSTCVIHAGVEDKLQFYMFQQRFMKVPRLRYMNYILFILPITMALRHNLPYIQLFNRYMSNMRAAGLLEKMYANNERSGVLSGEIRYVRSEPSSKHLLTLEYYYLPFALYVFGLGLAVMAFLAEILYYKWIKMVQWKMVL